EKPPPASAPDHSSYSTTSSYDWTSSYLVSNQMMTCTCLLGDVHDAVLNSTLLGLEFAPSTYIPRDM
ncbi:unnamed protein product, partial [Mycena citricolor]